MLKLPVLPPERAGSAVLAVSGCDQQRFKPLVRRVEKAPGWLVESAHKNWRAVTATGEEAPPPAYPAAPREKSRGN